MTDTSLGNLIRHLREQAALSQEELAVRAQVARTTIQNVETHRRVPRSSGLRRIAAALGVDVSVLLGAKSGDAAEPPAAVSAEELRLMIAETEDEIENLAVKHERNRAYLVAHLQKRLTELRQQLDSLR